MAKMKWDEKTNSIRLESELFNDMLDDTTYGDETDDLLDDIEQDIYAELHDMPTVKFTGKLVEGSSLLDFDELGELSGEVVLVDSGGNVTEPDSIGYVPPGTWEVWEIIG
jgi:hypothetical protein